MEDGTLDFISYLRDIGHKGGVKDVIGAVFSFFMEDKEVIFIGKITGLHYDRARLTLGTDLPEYLDPDYLRMAPSKINMHHPECSRRIVLFEVTRNSESGIWSCEALNYYTTKEGRTWCDSLQGQLKFL